MGLCYKTSRWLDRLWSEHLEISQPARDLIKEGVQKQGSDFSGFPSDLHARLYLPSDPPETDEAPEWASQLHTLASELGEWQRLRSMCSRNGFAAGIAAEAMLEQLVPHVPDRPTAEGCSPEAPSSDADLRAALRQATRLARDAVQEAESQLEGVSTPLGFSMPGTNTALNTGPANLKAIRDAHSRLTSSSRLQRIAELAGRLERVAASKARSKVRPGIGEIHGIELGGELDRLLPSELVALRHPRLRLVSLARLLQRKAMVYGMTGREPQSRGPIVILLDESGSMREHGKDVWSKAVCLALLSTATRQKRAWHLVGFNGAITREVSIPIGKATAADIQEALDHGCHGGTDFDLPVLRAINVIQTAPTMKQADVVIITEGISDLEPETVKNATALTFTEGVSWFVVGVGPAAEHCGESLGPIATSIVRISDTNDSEPIVPVINLSRE